MCEGRSGGRLHQDVTRRNIRLQSPVSGQQGCQCHLHRPQPVPGGHMEHGAVTRFLSIRESFTQICPLGVVYWWGNISIFRRKENYDVKMVEVVDVI